MQIAVNGELWILVLKGTQPAELFANILGQFPHAEPRRRSGRTSPWLVLH